MERLLSTNAIYSQGLTSSARPPAGVVVVTQRLPTGPVSLAHEMKTPNDEEPQPECFSSELSPLSPNF